MVTDKIAHHFNPRPLAGATYWRRDAGKHTGDFNPRPLAGATYYEVFYNRATDISIHAPLRGRPGRPLAGATIAEKEAYKANFISIHAPLRGRPSHSVAIFMAF